jgi:hypothetical protein
MYENRTVKLAEIFQKKGERYEGEWWRNESNYHIL